MTDRSVPAVATQPDPLIIPIPLPNGRGVAYFRLPRTMSERDWSQMLIILDAFKPGLVKQKEWWWYGC